MQRILSICDESQNPFIISDAAAERNIEQFHLVNGALQREYQAWCYPSEDPAEPYQIESVWLDPQDHVHARAVDPSYPEILLDQIKVTLEPTSDHEEQQRRKEHYGYVAYAEAYEEYVKEYND